MRKLQSWQESNDLIGKQFAHVPRGGMVCVIVLFFFLDVGPEREKEKRRKRTAGR